MQKLCPSDLKLTKKDFLAQGADGGGKGDFQGCSEFNPVLIFSQEKQEKFDQAKQKNDKPTLAGRNAQNAPNRRVMVLMFRKGSRIDPQVAVPVCYRRGCWLQEALLVRWGETPERAPAGYRPQVQ